MARMSCAALSHKFGYGVGDEMDFLLSKYTRGVAADGPWTTGRLYPDFAPLPKTHRPL